MSGVGAELSGKPAARTIRFAFFTNEEPPAFQSPDMGSWVYAKRCRAMGDRIFAMLSLETMGFYSDEPGSQNDPPPVGALYPDRGTFIALVGNTPSAELTRRVVESFRRHAAFPSEGAVLWSAIRASGGPTSGRSDESAIRA